MPGRVMMVAGDPSGDLHGASVVRELKRRLPTLDVYGIGGDRMRTEGMELTYHSVELSFMGFVEVAKNLRLVFEVERSLRRLLVERRPDIVVLIDYPGFNLRFARTAHGHGVKVLYYISPQVWAWNRRRVKKIKRTVDAMKVVFPFEVDLYRSEGIDVEFVGHPLVERLESNISREEFFRTYSLNPRRKLLALLPGSRLQEVRTMLPVMVEAARRLSEGGGVQAAIGVAPNLGGDAVRAFVPAGAQITVVENATYDLMKHADTAIVTSGTATLETGWFGTPMVVVYKTSFLTYLVGRMLVRVPHIGLVNIVAGKQIVPEFVQHEMTPERLVSAVGKILGESSHARRIREELAVIRQRLGAPGASSRVAEAIIALGGLA